MFTGRAKVLCELGLLNAEIELLETALRASGYSKSEIKMYILEKENK